MTGFGRSISDTPFGKLTVEIQSVNRKYLEVSFAGPKEFARFEQEVRVLVNAAVSRGQVSVRLTLTQSGTSALVPDIQMLKELKTSWQQIAHSLGYSPQEITLPFLIQYLPPLTKEDADFQYIQPCVNQALADLVEMKKTEGAALGQDLIMRLKVLEKNLAKIEALSSNACEKMRQKLLEKMEEVLKSNLANDERLLKEVALFAEKVDITEEITRFRSHIAQFRSILKEQIVGRKMDFLIQEFGREINTIGSKAMDAQIAHLVVEIKVELEKMREQIQNIE